MQININTVNRFKQFKHLTTNVIGFNFSDASHWLIQLTDLNNLNS